MNYFRYVETAADGIKLYHEEADAVSTTARELLSGAKRICFLGFGYNPFNVDRLKVRGSLDLSTTVIGTTRGLIGGELETRKADWRKHWPTDIRLVRSVNSEDNLTILRDQKFLD